MKLYSVTLDLILRLSCTDLLNLVTDSDRRQRPASSSDVMAISVDNASMLTEWVGLASGSSGYTCKLGQGKKINKFGGITSFVQFPLTPTFSNIQVSRR